MNKGEIRLTPIEDSANYELAVFMSLGKLNIKLFSAEVSHGTIFETFVYRQKDTIPMNFNYPTIVKVKEEGMEERKFRAGGK